MNIFQLMEMLEEEITESDKVAFSSMKKVDPERVNVILQEMRQNLPEEIRQAELIRQEKQSIIEDGRMQSEVMIRDAERRVRDMLDEHEITERAMEKANEIIANAQKNARDIRMGAKAYAEDVLDDMERYMVEYIETIRKNRESLAGKYARGDERTNA